MKSKRGKNNLNTSAIVSKKRRFSEKSTLFLVKIAMLSAISAVLYLALGFPIFPPPFHMFKLDFAEIPVLIGGFALGPVAAVAIEGIKVLVGILFSGLSWGGVGDLSNLLVNLSFVVPASIFYRYFRTKKGAFLALAIGNACLYLVSSLSNYFIMMPLAGLTAEPMMSTIVMVGLGFNAIKGIANSVLAFILYKKLSPILKLESVPKQKPILGMHTVKGLKGTESLAKRFAKIMTGGEIILISGDLGAGKTTFTKYFFTALGAKDRTTSPTFNIMKKHVGSFDLYHYDLYRIEDSGELEELGFDEFLGEANSISVIEWNKFEALRGKIFNIEIVSTGDNSRTILIEKQLELPENSSTHIIQKADESVEKEAQPEIL